MLPTLLRVFRRRRPILRRHGCTRLIRFWIHLFQRDANPRFARFGSASPRYCPAAIALRAFAPDSARVGTPNRSMLRPPKISKTSCAEIMQPIFLGIWVIDVANGSSIPERSKGSAGVAQQRMTQLSRTAATPQLASTSLRKSAHLALRSACPIQGRATRPIYLASLAGRGRKPRAAQLSDEGKDSAAIYGS